MTLMACVQIPQFPIAVARRDTPALAEMPLLLYTTAQSRAMVYAADCGTNVPAGMRLQRAHLLADERLGDAQACGRGGEAARLDDGEKRQRLIEASGNCFHLRTIHPLSGR